jgi:DNA adenine methylase
VCTKPFLKWAGGKNQLLPVFNQRLPNHIIENKTIETYVEPFVGGGAMFFNLKKNYKLKESVLSDINRELVMAYQVIKNDHEDLIDLLTNLEEHHLKMDEEGRKENYYCMRKEYNNRFMDMDFVNYNNSWVERTSYLIFMNKTCFNGLYRQNKQGGFNVPFGRYKNPTICDSENIRLVNKALKNTEILCVDFTETGKYVHENTFVYLDPPYRPLNRTSNFTSYSKEGFNDVDQIKLASFYREMNDLGACLMLSNSDPKNYDAEDEFFDELYQDFKIERVAAKRNINSNASGRGLINELIITNY